MSEKQDLAQLRGIVATGTPLAATTVLALIDRVQAAEQTVARVREVAETSTDKFLTMAIFEALDGDTHA